MQPMSLCQIALSTMDLARTYHWYRHTLGFLPAGGRIKIATENAAEVPGLPEAVFETEWLVDRQPFSQFEIFEFSRPRMRPQPADRRPDDIGYSMIGMHVADFDAALARLAATSGRVSEPVGVAGHRRARLRDPDGIWLELMEDSVGPARSSSDERTTCPVALRTVTLSVPDLAQARRFWVDVLGFPALDLAIHTPDHEAMWGLAGIERRSLVVGTGQILVELVEYIPRGRARPAGQLIADQGILNVALGSTDMDAFTDMLGRIHRAGYRTFKEPWHLPGFATVGYFTNDQGFSIELMHVESLTNMRFVPTA